MRQRAEPSYKTKDINVAAAIRCYNETMSVEIDGDGLGVFIFSNTEQCAEIEEAYWRGELLVDPKKISILLKELKSRTRSAF
jgi:hypothetical protein